MNQRTNEGKEILASVKLEFAVSGSTKVRLVKGINKRCDRPQQLNQTVFELTEFPQNTECTRAHTHTNKEEIT